MSTLDHFILLKTSRLKIIKTKNYLTNLIYNCIILVVPIYNLYMYIHHIDIDKYSMYILSFIT